MKNGVCKDCKYFTHNLRCEKLKDFLIHPRDNMKKAKQIKEALLSGKTMQMGCFHD